MVNTMKFLLGERLSGERTFTEEKGDGEVGGSLEFPAA